MTLSSSGTTATINQGAGTTQNSPGFSSKPIKLTPLQKAHRTMKKLKELGVGVGEESKEPTKTKTTLSELEEKYGTKKAA
jgi:hypothetical protein